MRSSTNWIHILLEENAPITVTFVRSEHIVFRNVREVVNMVKVAVAGGGQGLGRVIVEAIESRGLHECFILSRNAHEDDPRCIVVDYANIESLQAVLEANELHTVISTLSMENGGGESQMNLIEAADRSRSTCRFMPSEFGMVYKRKYVSRCAEIVTVEANCIGSRHITALPSYAWKLKAVERLNQSSLEYTLFSNGMFLDYMTSPRVPTPLPFSVPVWIDLENKFAAIPGDGEGVIAMTHTSDISRFVAAVLDLPHWEKRYHLIGDRLSINNMVRVAEEIIGVTFHKHYDQKENLLKHRSTLLPTAQALLFPGIDEAFIMGMVAAAGVRVIDDEMDLDVNLSVNRLFPDMKTRTFRDAVQIWKEAET